jgi:hypothetical protein
MSDRLDDLLRAALAEAPDLEPAPSEVLAAVRAAGPPRGRAVRRPWRAPLRLAAAAWCALGLAAGGALAVPASRDAIAGALSGIERLVTGGEQPGTPVPPDGDALNWLDDALPDTPRALARAGDERLVLYRQRGTDFACLSIGRHATECGDLAHWRARVAPGPLAPLFTTPPDTSGMVAVWGLVGAGATRVEVRYRDGGATAAAATGPGFVVLADPAREPVSAVALDARGQVLGTAPLTGLRFRFCEEADGC